MNHSVQLIIPNTLNQSNKLDCIKGYLKNYQYGLLGSIIYIPYVLGKLYAALLKHFLCSRIKKTAAYYYVNQ